jgi:hypothetical protein
MSADSSNDVRVAPVKSGSSSFPANEVNAGRRSLAKWGCCAVPLLGICIAIGYWINRQSVPYEYREVRANQQWFEQAAADALSGRPMRSETLEHCPFRMAMLNRVRIVEGVCEGTENKAVLFVFVEALSVYDPFVVVVPTDDFDFWKWAKKFNGEYGNDLPQKVAPRIWYFRAKINFEINSKPKN